MKSRSTKKITSLKQTNLSRILLSMLAKLQPKSKFRSEQERSRKKQTDLSKKRSGFDFKPDLCEGDVRGAIA